MKVKNVSSSKIDVPEFKLSLKPGDVGDLSSFDLALVRSHTLLGAFFEKGLLINLGQTTLAGSKATLNSARDRITKLNVLGTKDDYIIKQAKKRSQTTTRTAIADSLKNYDRRAPLASDLETSSRYEDEYFMNMHPGEDEPEEYLRPRIKIEEKFRPTEIQWNGSMTFGQNGQIQTGIITGETTHLAPDPDTLILKDPHGNEHKLSLTRIKEKMLRRCIGSNSAGRPCKKYAIHGFQSCLRHMSRTERTEYDQLRAINDKTK